MEKNINIKLYTERVEISAVPPFVAAAAGVAMNTEQKDDVDKIEMFTEGKLKIDGNMVEIYYEETEMSGMAGAVTRMIFDSQMPEVVTMMRTGPVKVTMVFQKGLRHNCRYDTGIIPFDMTLTTSFVDNRLSTDGELYIDYTTELAGSSKAITRLRMRIWDMVEEE